MKLKSQTIHLGRICMYIDRGKKHNVSNIKKVVVDGYWT